MILPGTTISPPNFLTPSRRPGLSRPLRDDPPAFLCAILGLLCFRRRGLRFSLRCSPAASARRAGGMDFSDPQYGLMLAVAVLAPVILPPLLFEDDDLVGAAVFDQGRADRGAGDQ